MAAIGAFRGVVFIYHYSGRNRRTCGLGNGRDIVNDIDIDDTCGNRTIAIGDNDIDRNVIDYVLTITGGVIQISCQIKGITVAVNRVARQ